MEKEVDPAVLAVINEKRLMGDKRTPVEIIAKMGVFEARDKASDHAWLATGDNIIATIWAEYVSIGAGGRWFVLESLDTQRRIDGGERSVLQIQRGKDRLALLKRALDADKQLRVVLQTNRVAIGDLETDKAAKVSVRVPDDQDWHVGHWDQELKMAILIRGPRGWLPSHEDIETARLRGSLPAPKPEVVVVHSTREEVQAAAMAYVIKHFAGYGYKTEDVSSQKLGYDIEVSDKKGNTLLKVAVKGTAPGVTSFQLTSEERAGVKRGDPWRLVVVMDAGNPAAQHKLYKPTEIDSAPGLEPMLA
ncbi:MAG: hypothetical protein JWQ41_3008 [Variovorax sp.]|jgi:hypothetical protein|nr:hypothetical protein [Variovorax sp.]